MFEQSAIRLERRARLLRKMNRLLYSPPYDDDDRQAVVYEMWRTIGGPLTGAQRQARYRLALQNGDENVTLKSDENVTGGCDEQSDVWTSSSSSSSSPTGELLEKQKLTTRPNPANPNEWGSAEALVTLYNRLIPAGHPRVTRLTPARKDKARKYLRDFPEEKFWTGVFSEIQFSSLLRGRIQSDGHRSFRGDFDWLLTRGKDGTENAVKVHEGKYRDA